ncbi:putative efflux pump outer membrane protein TtgC [uncultured delta proteobacterium]|uniref:Putative efflux pump outer membrane protein TtgC n=1 Tax=uncultured delta proteobacterium TaxID=34034 RepID=A0A212JNR8_9DELT|nr:putative efflux pump outer membrane protein TtgC [uncultured delta proteobacterium]
MLSVITKRTSFFLVPVILLTVMTGGCTMAPKYIRPDAPIPNTYHRGTSNDSVELPGWKVFFADQTMQRVIELALENNRDLRLAMLNVERTRAQYRIQRADLLPTINAEGGASIQHLPADSSPTGVKGITRQYTAGLGFSAFELDLFGRIRSLTDQALETYYSTEQEARAAQLTLIAETAAMYLQLVADREQYDLTAATMENRRKSYELMRNMFESEIISDLEVSQAQTLLDEAKVRLAAAATQVEQDANYLALLMGTSIPSDLPEVRKLADVTQLHDIPEGLPSSLLERRPDILAAEHILKGSNANIGAARANFFPRISLTGAFGKMSSDYNNLWDGASKTWSFLPQITLPIFDMGRNVALLEVSEAERDIAVARYEKTIQTAFMEVANTLIQRDHIGSQLKAQESLVAATERSYRYSSTRHSSGISSFINVLDAERSLFAAQSDLISTRLLREANALSLYKALGGSWDELEHGDSK